MRNDGYNCAGQLEIMAVNEEQKMTRGRFTVMFCATIEQRGDDRRDTEVLPEGAVVLVDRGADTTEEALVLVDGELAPEQRAVLERAFRVPRSGAQGSRAAFSEVLGLLGLDQPRRVGERWSLGSDAVLEILPEDLVNHDGLEAEGYAELFVFDGSRGLDEGTPCFGESCHELRVTLEASSLPSMMGERAVQDSANATITLSALIPFESSLPIWQADMRLSINASGTITAPGSDSPAVMLMNIVIDKRRVMTPLPSGQD